MTIDIQAIIAEHQDGKLAPLALSRALIQYTKWQIPADLSEGGPTPLLGQADEGPWLHLFSSKEAQLAFEKETGQGIEFTLEMSGLFVFSQLQDQLAGININPHSETAIHFKAHQLTALKVMAEGLILDEVLHGRLELPDAFDRFKRY